MEKEFAERLINLRKRHGLSQEQLGDKLFVSRQAVSKWECGEAIPDIDNLILLAQLFDISLDELVNGDPAFDKAQTNSEQKTSDSLKRISYEISLNDSKKRIRQFHFYYAKRWLFPAILLIVASVVCWATGYTILNDNDSIVIFGYLALGFVSGIVIINCISIGKSIKFHVDDFNMVSKDGKIQVTIEQRPDEFIFTNGANGNVTTYRNAEISNAVIYKDIFMIKLMSKHVVILPNIDIIRNMFGGYIGIKIADAARKEKKKKIAAIVVSCVLFIIPVMWAIAVSMPFIMDTAYYHENNTQKYTATVDYVEFNAKVGRYEIYLENDKKYLCVKAEAVKGREDLLNSVAVGDEIVYRVRRDDEEFSSHTNQLNACAIAINGADVLTLEQSTAFAKKGFVPIWIVLPVIGATFISIGIYILARTFKKSYAEQNGG